MTPTDARSPHFTVVAYSHEYNLALVARPTLSYIGIFLHKIATIHLTPGSGSDCVCLGDFAYLWLRALMCWTG